jgi:hypothetical protein
VRAVKTVVGTVLRVIMTVVVTVMVPVMVPVQCKDGDGDIGHVSDGATVIV